MNEWESGLVAYLLLDTELAVMVGNRFYPDRAPQGEAYPHLTWTRQTTDRQRHLGGSAGLAKALLEIDAIALERLTARKIVARVRALLEGYRGSWNGFVIQACFVTDEDDNYDPPQRADDTPVYHTRMDVEVWFEETAYGVAV